MKFIYRILNYFHFLLPAKWQNSIGLYYWNRGEYDDAFYWYLRAAKKKFKTAYYNLGICFQEGTGVLKDHGQAFHWFDKAALLGDGNAQFNLGLYYQKGIGVEADVKKAVSWIQKAADQGHPQALNRMGDMCQYGDGVVVNPHKAIQYYQKGVEKKLPLSYLNLAICYMSGIGCDVDYSKAHQLLLNMPKSEKTDKLKLLNLGLCEMLIKPRKNDLFNLDDDEIISLFCRALLDKDVTDIHHFISKNVLMIRNGKESTYQKHEFLLWIITFQRFDKMGRKPQKVDGKIIKQQVRSFIYIVVDEIHEYEIDLAIVDGMIKGINIRPSFYSFEVETLNSMFVGVVEAKKLMDQYVSSNLESDSFAWITNEPITEKLRYDSVRCPHLSFCYKGKKYSIMVELYDDKSSVYMSKEDFEDFIKHSEEDNYKPCIIQLDNETMQPCHIGHLLQDAVSGEFINLEEKEKKEEKDYHSLTNATKEENLNSITDEFGVRYSPDGKKLISTPVSLKGEYKIKDGTESICDSAFQYKVWLIKVQIPESVKYIGRCAFVHCENLMNANLPKMLEYLGDMAFLTCNLSYIFIPENIKKIPKSCFAGNRELKRVFLHNEIEVIGPKSFSECKELERFTFPSKIKIIENEVLFRCWNLKKVILPEGITTIKNLAFAETAIETIVIPKSVEFMGDFLFTECRNFKGVEIPDSVKNISKHALAKSYVWD